MTYNNDSNSSLTSLIMQGIMNALADTHTIIIGQIEKVNKTTIDVQPVIARNINGKEEPLPVFPDVPVVNFLGGTSSIQMPLAKGDDCVLFVSERCFDGWYYGNKNQKPMHPRMFDYSDCVAFVGLKNKAGELEIPDRIKMIGDTLQIGDYEHQGNRLQTGNYEHNGNMEQVGDFTMTGNQLVNGNFVVNGGSSGGQASMNGTTFSLPASSDLVIATSLGNISLRAFIENHYHTGDSGGNTGKPKL